MKKLFVVIAILCICGTAYAAQTGTTAWHSHSYTDNDTCNYVDKYSEYQKKLGLGMGIGADIVAYEFDGALNQVYGLDSVNVETKWDINNQSGSVYGVVHANAWRVIENLLK